MGGIKSGRKEHIAANHNAAYLAGIAALFLWQSLLPAFVAWVACGLMENWATPDRDLEENRKLNFSKLYWGFYGHSTPHRSRWSHSLLFGLPVRLLWGFWPILLMLWGYAPQILPAVLLGAVAADCTHMRLDGYNPVEMLMGK